MLEGLDEYASQQEMDAAVKNAGDALRPLEGVVFKYTKVGDVGQYVNEGTVRTGYTVNEKTKEFLGLADVREYETVDGIDYYNVRVLEEALRNKKQSEIEMEYKPYKEDDITTNAAGIAKASDLSTGLYLVYEYSYPSEVNVTTAPFFVSVPMTDDGKEWVYDVNVYPKNQTEQIDIGKSILSDHGETRKTDAEIGKEVTFKIRADVPDNIGKMKTYMIQDVLEKGMDFVRELNVYGVKEDGTKEELTPDTQYQFAQEDRQLSYTFHTETLADAAKMAKYESIEITYAVKLNGNALVGEANVNKASLTYSKKTNLEAGEQEDTITTDPVKALVYTYAVDLLKYGSGDISNTLENVTFQLLDADKNEIKVAKEGSTYYPDANGTETVKSDRNGKVYVKGLKAGTYYIRETKTNKGYNLLKDDIEIKLTPEKGTYTDDSTDEIKVNTNYSMSRGVVAVKVNNTKGFLLPATGGMGTIRFLAVGGMLVLAGLCVMKGTGRKKNYIA